VHFVDPEASFVAEGVLLRQCRAGSRSDWEVQGSVWS
jgi:hypothetical protein